MLWIVTLVVASNQVPICHSEDWGVVIRANADTCQDVVRAIADNFEPAWRENPFSNWHNMLDDAEDGEISIVTNSAYANDQPDRQNKREARLRAWVTCLAISRDRMTNRHFKYKRRR